MRIVAYLDTSRGWDWGPILMTCGPWRDVRLETYHARIAELRVDYAVKSNFSQVSGCIVATVEGSIGKVVKFSTMLGKQLVMEQAAVVGSDGTATVSFHINDAKLWYPFGYGEQPLYTVKATLTDGKHELHTDSKRVGFRQGELIQDRDEIGKSFYFRINGIDVFCGGSDWIPADSFTPSITKDRYRKWLQMLVDGYQSMIRYVEGGHKDCQEQI